MIKNILKNRIIIIGSSGFIGNACSKIFKENNIKFVSINSKKCNLLKKNSYKFLNKTIKNGDIVLFISAIAPCKNINELKKNLEMISPLINISKKIKISQLIYISSDAVYADHKKKN